MSAFGAILNDAMREARGEKPYGTIGGEPTGAVMINGEKILRGEEARGKKPREVLRDKHVEGVKVSADGRAITFLLEDFEPVTLTFPEEGNVRKVVWHGIKDTFLAEYVEFAVCKDGRARLYIATEDAGSLSYDQGTVIEVYMSGITRFTALECDEAEDHSATVQAQQLVNRKWEGENFHIGEFAELGIMDPDDSAYAVMEHDMELYNQGYDSCDPNAGSHYWEDGTDEIEDDPDGPWYGMPKTS